MEARVKHSDELWLLPREHLKSTILTIARNIQRILSNRNKTILICNAVKENAVAFLSEIKQHFETNSKLHELYPWSKGRVKWDETRITLPRTAIVKEPTIQIAGVGQSFASRHYDYIDFDDLLNERNTESITQVEKVIKWFKQVYPLLKQDGQRSVVGTRWTYGDLYEYIQREYPDFFVYIRKIKEEGKFIFPRRFDQKRHDKLKMNMKGFLFSCQYYNEPIAEGDQLFKPEYFRYLDIEEIEKIAGLSKYMIVDPASTRKVSSDFTGMLVFGIDALRNRYIVDAKRDKYTPEEQIQDIFAFVQKHKLRIVGIESFGFQAYLKFNLEQEMNRRRTEGNPCDFTIIELTPKGRSKPDRISAIEPILRNRKLYFVKESYHESIYDKQVRDYIDVLRTEMLQFPKSEHDDLTDCLAYAVDIDPFVAAYTEITTKTLDEFKKKDPFDNDFEEWEDELRIRYGPGGTIIQEAEPNSSDPVTGY